MAATLEWNLLNKDCYFQQLYAMDSAWPALRYTPDIFIPPNTEWLLRGCHIFEPAPEICVDYLDNLTKVLEVFPVQYFDLLMDIFDTTQRITRGTCIHF